MGHSVLPKSANEARLKENFDIFDWCIPEDLLAKFPEIEQASSIFFSSLLLSCIEPYISIFFCTSLTFYVVKTFFFFFLCFM